MHILNFILTNALLNLKHPIMCYFEGSLIRMAYIASIICYLNLPNAHTTILLNKISHRANTTFFPVSKISFWHTRLSHANHKAIHRTLQMFNISFNNKEPYSFCQSCCFGKSHRLFAPMSSG